MQAYKSKYKEQKALITFWENLKIGYDKFFNERQALSIKVTDNGDYGF
jgi:murein L,D-transpeptidase YafK